MVIKSLQADDSWQEAASSLRPPDLSTETKCVTHVPGLICYPCPWLHACTPRKRERCGQAYPPPFPRRARDLRQGGGNLCGLRMDSS